jgi:hypothetical protein
MDEDDINDICEALEITIDHLEGHAAPLAMSSSRRIELLRSALRLLRKLLPDD